MLSDQTRTLPSDWRLRRVSDISTTYAGGTPSRSNPKLFGGTIPWVRSSELNQPEIRESEETLTDQGFTSSSAKWVPADTPLIAMYGATAGTVSWLSVKATTNQAVLAVLPKRLAETEPRWLYWVLKFHTRKLLTRLQGSGQPNLSKSIVDRLLLPEPPLAEQRRIAEILDTADAAIRETEAVINKLKQVKAGLLNDLLTRGLDENGQLRDPERHPEQFKETEIGLVPRGWEVASVGDEIELISGRHISSNLYNDQGHGVPYFTGPVDFVGDRTRITNYTEHPKVMCEANDILITVKGSGCGKVALAGHAACISRQLMAIRVSEPDVRYWLNLLKVKEPYFNRLSTGSAIPGLSRRQILDLRIALPKRKERVAIIAILTAEDERIKAEEAYRTKLLKIKRGLMQDLLTGRVRV